MAVAVEMSLPGVTLDQYHQIIQRLGAQNEGPHPDPGCLFHWAAAEGDNLRVTDVWSSQDQWERYAQERIAPLSDEVGIAMPEVKVTPIDTYMTAGS
jgi:hypothetical protein